MSSFLTDRFKHKVVAVALVAAAAVGLSARDAFAQQTTPPQNTKTPAAAPATAGSVLASRERAALAEKTSEEAMAYSKNANGVSIYISLSPEQEKLWPAATLGQTLQTSLAKYGAKNSQVFIEKEGYLSGQNVVKFAINGELFLVTTVKDLDSEKVVTVALAQQGAEAVQRSKSSQDNFEFNLNN